MIEFGYHRPLCNTQQQTQRRLALAVPLRGPRFLVRRGSALVVRPLHAMSDSEKLVIYPMPSLVATLINRERVKGSPLTEAEVIEIRDSCPSVAIPVDMMAKIDTERGYKDIDPERCWDQWQEARKNLS